MIGDGGLLPGWLHSALREMDVKDALLPWSSVRILSLCDLSNKSEVQLPHQRPQCAITTPCSMRPNLAADRAGCWAQIHSNNSNNICSPVILLVSDIGGIHAHCEAKTRASRRLAVPGSKTTLAEHCRGGCPHSQCLPAQQQQHVVRSPRASSRHHLGPLGEFVCVLIGPAGVAGDQ